MKRNEVSESQVGKESSTQPAAERAAALQRMIDELLRFPSEDRRTLIETLVAFFGINTMTNESVTRAAPPSSPPRGTSFQFSEGSDCAVAKSIYSTKIAENRRRTNCMSRLLPCQSPRDPPFQDQGCYRSEHGIRPQAIFKRGRRRQQRNQDGLSCTIGQGGQATQRAQGEQFVEALPDRLAAKEALQRLRHRRVGRASKKDRAKVERE